jgi:ABC-type nitrate/sulfonate/bicarbonate transport system substrate-binding protein
VDKRLADFAEEWRNGDRSVAKEMATAYVEAHREEIETMIRAAVRANREARLDAPAEIADLVQLVGAYRRAGDEESRILVDMVLLDGYAPQVITGDLGVIPSLALAKAVNRG